MGKKIPYKRLARPASAGLKKEIRAVAKSVIAKQSELKYFDTTVGPSIDDAGYLSCLSLVPQGDTDTSRDGDQLYATSMQVKGYFSCADTTNQVRLIFFIWKPETSPTNDDILATTTKGSINYVNAPYHHDGRGSFTVLSDRCYSLALGTTSAKKQFSHNIKLNKKLKYNAGTTAGYNQIWFMVLSDSAAVSHPSVNMTSRLRFRDY